MNSKIINTFSKVSKMNILWITNITFPEAIARIKGDTEFTSSGGWMIGASEALVHNEDVNLTVASLSCDVDELTFIKGDYLSFFLLPYGKGNLKYNKEYESYWKVVNNKVRPDIVHIHGTEYSHGLAYVNACGAKHVVVSIQGLVSVVSDYYFHGLSFLDIISNISLLDIVQGSLICEKNQMKKRGKMEKAFIQKVNHVIGRTDWDKAHVWEINQDAKYHFCNEILRNEFYEGPYWQYNKCKRHTIFLSQASYPIKGLHQLLKAMPLILKEYPDTKIRISGHDITKSLQIKGLIPSVSGYGKFIRKLIHALKLSENIEFIGCLDAIGMKQEYLNCNVFVCPSSIENSPNSLGEAQILGTPCVCSYVGGVPNMMQGDETHLYRFEEYPMLANIICDVFRSRDFPSHMREVARKRHDKNTNTRTLTEIYCEIAKY